jgi:hypothetical protein
MDFQDSLISHSRFSTSWLRARLRTVETVQLIAADFLRFLSALDVEILMNKTTRMWDLQTLLSEVASSGWQSGASQRLVDAIEDRIVASVPSRLRAALGNDEAAQLARIIAWERCRELAISRPESGVNWGYLANTIRWRLADAVRSEALRRQRHPLVHTLPEAETPRTGPDLGPILDRIAMEVERAGLPLRDVRRLLLLAGEGPRFERSAIAARLLESGATRGQAEGLAWLLRGGAANPSALSRLAAGQPPARVFRDPVVRRWITAAAGRDPSFVGGRSGGGSRRRSGPRGDQGPDLLRTA